MIFAAIDWGEQEHFVVMLDEAGEILERRRVQHEHYELALLDQLLASRPAAEVHVAIEMHDSLLLDRLLALGVKVYGLNPKSAQRARERFTPTGVKDDERDAWSMAEFLRTGHQHLRCIKPESEATLALREWVRLREDLSQERRVHLQQLHAHLVRWHPHVRRSAKDLEAEWVLDLLEAYPTADTFAALSYRRVMNWCRGRGLRVLTRDRLANAAVAASPTKQPARNAAHAAEVLHRVQAIRHLNAQLKEIESTLDEAIRTHPDAVIFEALPAAGTLTVAALLAGFGEDRDRWEDHEELQTRWGTAPITIKSGKFRGVRRRRACDTTIHQAWIWFTFNTVRKEDCWAREAYQAKRKAGCTHYTALRGIANHWVKIATACWKTRTPYSEEHHQRSQALRRQPRIEK
ncbi:MAG: IS110 family transposase [Burkholderiales bacterium]